MRSLVCKKTLSTLLLVLVFFSLGFLLLPNSIALAADPLIPGFNAENAGAGANQTRAQNNGEEPAEKETCGLFNIGQCIHDGITYAIEGILGLFAYLVGIAGSLLNSVVDLTIVKMSAVMNPSGSEPSSITIAWRLFRDIANILLIFSLLAVGIAVILQVEGYGIKSLLPKIIIIALLINFSLFFCKAAIDFTNIFALRFYDSIMTAAENSNSQSKTNLGLGALVMDNLRLTSLYDVGQGSAQQAAVGPGLGLTKVNLSTGSILLIGFAGSILFVIVAAVFFAAGLSLIARFIMLLFLTVLSPLAFVAYILPGTKKKYWDPWFESFLKNALFAPLYMVLLWASFTIVSGLHVERILRGLTNEQLSDFAKFSALATNPSSVGPLILNFIIVCGFFVGSLVIAKQMGAYGASGTLGGLNSLRKWGQSTAVKYGSRLGYGVTAGAGATAMRLTFGRQADKWSTGENLKKLQAQRAEGGLRGLWAGAKLATFKGVAKSSFELGNLAPVKAAAKTAGIDLGLPKDGGFADREKRKKEKFEKRADEYSSAKDAADDLRRTEQEKALALGLTDEGRNFLGAERNLTQRTQALAAAEAAYEELIRNPSSDPARVRAADDARVSARREADRAGVFHDSALTALSEEEQREAQVFNNRIAELAQLVREGGMRGRYTTNVAGKTWELFNGMAKHRREETVRDIIRGKSPEKKLLDDLKKAMATPAPGAAAPAAPPPPAGGSAGGPGTGSPGGGGSPAGASAAP